MTAEPQPSTDDVANAREKLSRLDHIVVLQLENRSFDHMLGYLGNVNPPLKAHSGEPGVRGVQHAKPNGYQGRDYPPEEFQELAFERHGLDPPHDADQVATQLAGGAMTGFVEAWAGKLKKGPTKWPKRLIAKLLGRPYPDPEDLRAVMGHLTPDMVPVFDHLAREFCVCDHWFCSVAGPTMPNRYFSVAATHDGVMSNVKLLLTRRGEFKSLFRCLPDPAMWRWYSSDPGILRAIDGRYQFDIEKTASNGGNVDHFAYFDEATDRQPRTFLGDVLEEEELPEVAWIDPNFALAAMVPVVGGIVDGVGSNDDHPPVGVIEAQRLVNKVYEALGRSADGRYWNNTLFVVYYDEHGGFYDHAAPPEGCGPRIPALLVGGPVKPGVCHTVLDHASLIKTVLLRFGWDNLAELAPDARERIMAADDLSVALRDDGGTTPFSPVPDPGGAALCGNDLKPKRLARPASRLNRAIDLLDRTLTDLQEDIVKRHAIPLRTGRKVPARVPTKRLAKLAARRVPRGRNRLPDRHP